MQSLSGLRRHDRLQLKEKMKMMLKLQVTYFTDPLCAYCWVFEPTLQKFRLQYGNCFEFTIRMGGLMGESEGFPPVYDDPYNPSDIRDHWISVAASSHMPIDSGIWLTEPIRSSYPSSFLFLYIHKYHPAKAEIFLRELRETVFVRNKPIDREEVLLDLIRRIGLEDPEGILSASRNPEIQSLMKQDLEWAMKLKIEGFPTLVFHDPRNGDFSEKDILLFGARTYSYYVEGLARALGDRALPVPSEIPPLSILLPEQSFYYAKELAVLYDIELKEVRRYCRKHLLRGTYGIKTILGEIAVFSSKPLSWKDWFLRHFRKPVL